MERKLQQKDGEIAQLKEENCALREQVAQLTEQVRKLTVEFELLAEKKKSKKPEFPQNYSLSEQERKRTSGRRKKSPGRTPNEQKAAKVTKTEDRFPEGVSPEQCCHTRNRFAWRLQDGKTEFVEYRLHKEKWTPNSAQLPDVLPHTEYGLEVAVTLGYLVFRLGLSIDKAIEVLDFFTHLQLSRSQANRILDHLANAWETEFDTLVELMAFATVVYMDETGWRVSQKRCYTWVFTTLTHTVLLYGRTREASVLDEILPRDKFHGIGVSDDYSAYQNRFTKGQKCWAHLLRKAIQLMLTNPTVDHYRLFFEGLLAIFRKAKQDQIDRRLQSTGREGRVAKLEEHFQDLINQFHPNSVKEKPKDFNDFVLLMNELVRCMANNELFTFVRHPEADGTNNASERLLRSLAEARKTNRTSKTDKGAKRRSIISSVMESLRCQLGARFSMSGVMETLQQWVTAGVSQFKTQLEELKTVIQPTPEPRAASQ